MPGSLFLEAVLVTRILLRKGTFIDFLRHWFCSFYNGIKSKPAESCQVQLKHKKARKQPSPMAISFGDGVWTGGWKVQIQVPVLSHLHLAFCYTGLGWSRFVWCFHVKLQPVIRSIISWKCHWNCYRPEIINLGFEIPKWYSLYHWLKPIYEKRNERKILPVFSLSSLSLLISAVNT